MLVVAVSVAGQKLAHGGAGETPFWWVVLLRLPSLLTLLAGAMGSVWRGHVWGVPIWPTVTLESLGPRLGLWAGPE